MNPNFLSQIHKFNNMYGLPVADHPTTKLQPVLARMTAFRPILADELAEVDDIIADAGKDEIDDLVALSDWLGDIIVYCTSEAMRYGIPIGDVLEVIMESNFSKLGADGLPIVTNDKVQKGPNYWKPEPKIREVLLAHREGRRL